MLTCVGVCTGVCASVVLQVSGGGELLAAVLLAADEGFLSVVSPHVNLQPLQNIEALPTTLSATAERTVVPETHTHTETHTDTDTLLI